MIPNSILLQEISSLEIATSKFVKPVTDIHFYESEQKQEGSSISLVYSPNHKVDRIRKNGKKSFYCKHLDNGKWQSGLGDRTEWKPYGKLNFKYASYKWILIHEGEKATDYALSKGIVSSCIVGSGFKDEQIIANLINQAKENNIKGFVYIADNDSQGIKKAKYIQEVCLKFDFPCLIVPIGDIFTEGLEKDDIADWIIKYPDMVTGTIVNEVESFIDSFKSDLIKDYYDCDNTKPSDKERVKEASSNNNDDWLEKATNELFNDSWISLNGHLYQFNGQIYEEREDGYIIRKISNWCRNYTDSKGKKPCNKPSSVKEVFTWVNQLFWVSPNEVNQDGLPLKNGVLNITIEKGKPIVKLENYSPDKYFTYQSEVSYEPNIDRTQANKMLECLDEPYKSLLIQSLSTILNPKLIKTKWDRIKAIVLEGEGSNGKDTLREAISLILGKKGITGCSLNDFRLADTGRGFNLNRLAINPRINWSSENKQIGIDHIQTLKQAISGDPIYIESKGKDGFEVELNTLFIFNSNEKTQVKGDSKAIHSRVTIIPFNKVYSMSPEKGELQADPRFKHDKEFLCKEVCSGLLNILIEEFAKVYLLGINYSLASEYFDQLTLENNHLKRFSQDVGLVYTGNENDLVSIGDVYSNLTEWYHNEGFCDFENKGEKTKIIWLDENSKDDPVIKASRTLKPALLKVFPKAKEYKRDRVTYLRGLKLSVNSSLNSQNQSKVSLNTLNNESNYYKNESDYKSKKAENGYEQKNTEIIQLASLSQNEQKNNCLSSRTARELSKAFNEKGIKVKEKREEYIQQHFYSTNITLETIKEREAKAIIEKLRE